MIWGDNKWVKSSLEQVTTSLIYAREAVKQAPTWIRFHPKTNRFGFEPYRWCEIGWERNNYQGYFHDIPNALRPYTDDGDLTFWWHHGRSRRDMVELFDQAIAAPAGMEIPVNSAFWVRETPASAKLTRGQVREIRQRLAEGEFQVHLAREYGVHQQTISFIKRGLTWRNVA